jgi:hypothetical protein
MDDVPISKQTETQNMKLGHVYEPGILSENLGEPDFPKKTRSQIKGPDNPTSQLLPKMSFNGFSGDREGRKDKGGGERSRR